MHGRVAKTKLYTLCLKASVKFQKIQRLVSSKQAKYKAYHDQKQLLGTQRESQPTKCEYQSNSGLNASCWNMVALVTIQCGSHLACQYFMLFVSCFLTLALVQQVFISVSESPSRKVNSDLYQNEPQVLNI